MCYHCTISFVPIEFLVGRRDGRCSSRRSEELSSRLSLPPAVEKQREAECRRWCFFGRPGPSGNPRNLSVTPDGSNLFPFQRILFRVCGPEELSLGAGQSTGLGAGQSAGLGAGLRAGRSTGLVMIGLFP